MTQSLTKPTPDGITRGTVVGRYVVLQKLGRTTYEAHDPEHDRKVALKLLLPGIGGDDERLRFFREAHVLTRLSHPNIVGILDAVIYGEHVWVAMEFERGCTMGAWLHCPRAWREVLAVMRAAGEGLAAMHRFGALHYDFDAGHVLIGEDGRVRVNGLTLAILHTEPAVHGGEVTRKGVGLFRDDSPIKGPWYMAPEQLAEARYTTAIDRYRFCLTLWEALYGELPFDKCSIPEFLTSVIASKRRPPPEGSAVPTWLQRVCERGVLVDPAHRWPSMEALLEALA